MRQLAVLLISALVLGGCTSVVDSVTDEPLSSDATSTSIGTSLNDMKMDTYIGVNIKKADPELDKSHVNVHVVNGVVLLTGEVPSKELKVLAGDVAREFKGARQVYNELQVRGKSSVVSRTNDSVITAKLRTKFVFLKDIKSTKIEIVTEDSVVYLMGLIDRASAQEATDIARGTTGIRKVVQVFEYTD